GGRANRQDRRDGRRSDRDRRRRQRRRDRRLQQPGQIANRRRRERRQITSNQSINNKGREKCIRRKSHSSLERTKGSALKSPASSGGKASQSCWAREKKLAGTRRRQS